MNLGLVAFLLQVPSPSAPQATPPFAVGEILEYSARYGILRPGTARLAVVKVDTARGVPSWVFSFTFEVSLLRLYSNRSELTSWTGQSDFVSRRFLKEIEEKGKRRGEDCAIFPDARVWLTDDAQRLPVQIESTYSFGTVKLVLSRITLGHEQ